MFILRVGKKPSDLSMSVLVYFVVGLLLLTGLLEQILRSIVRMM